MGPYVASAIVVVSNIYFTKVTVKIILKNLPDRTQPNVLSMDVYDCLYSSRSAPASPRADQLGSSMTTIIVILRASPAAKTASGTRPQVCTTDTSVC